MIKFPALVIVSLIFVLLLLKVSVYESEVRQYREIRKTVLATRNVSNCSVVAEYDVESQEVTARARCRRPSTDYGVNLQ